MSKRNYDSDENNNNPRNPRKKPFNPRKSVLYIPESQEEKGGQVLEWGDDNVYLNPLQQAVPPEPPLQPLDTGLNEDEEKAIVLDDIEPPPPEAAETINNDLGNIDINELLPADFELADIEPLENPAFNSDIDPLEPPPQPLQSPPPSVLGQQPVFSVEPVPAPDSDDEFISEFFNNDNIQAEQQLIQQTEELKNNFNADDNVAPQFEFEPSQPPTIAQVLGQEQKQNDDGSTTETDSGSTTETDSEVQEQIQAAQQQHQNRIIRLNAVYDITDIAGQRAHIEQNPNSLVSYQVRVTNIQHNFRFNVEQRANNNRLAIFRQAVDENLFRAQLRAVYNMLAAYQFVHIRVGNLEYPRQRFLQTFLRINQQDHIDWSDEVVRSIILVATRFTVLVDRRANILGYERRGGNFFNFKNLSDFDLDILQIYKEVPSNITNTCFFDSLTKLGYSNKLKLDEIKIKINNGTVKNCDLTKFSKILDVGFVIYTLYQHNNGPDYDYQFFKKIFKSKSLKNPITYYKLINFENHYMPVLKLNISKDCIKYYFNNNKNIGKIKQNQYVIINTHDKPFIKTAANNDLEFVTDIFRTKVGGKRKMVKSTRDLRCDSLDIIKFLFNNHNELLEPLNANDMEQTNHYLNAVEEAYDVLPEVIKYAEPIVYNKENNYQIMDEKEREAYITESRTKTKWIEKKIKNNNKWYNFYEFNNKKINTKEIHKYKNNYILFFDIETYDDNTNNNNHKPYCCAVMDEEGNKNYFKGEDCILNFFGSLNGHEYIIYVHNLKFEIQFMFQYLTKGNNGKKSYRDINILESDGIYYECHGLFFNDTKKVVSKIKLIDSYKMISSKLEEFPKIFNMVNVKKELCLYRLYNINTIDLAFVSIEEAYKHCSDDDEKKQLCKNIDEWKLWEDENNKKNFNHIQYAIEYCIIDCDITRKGILKFREWIFVLCGLDIYNYLTLPSIAYQFLSDYGAFEGCYKLGGVPRHFIQKCVVGGRVMLNSNKRVISGGNDLNINNLKYKNDYTNELYDITNNTNTKIMDFDAVSLYPSAMYYSAGFVRGIPILLKENQLNIKFLNSVDFYFIKIKVIKCNKILQFPVLSYKDKKQNGKRIWENLSNIEIYVDKITLEDGINFNKIEYKILMGYYFNEGFNTKSQDCMKLLFEERAKYKKIKNPIQMVYKLIMNAAYGKTIEKAHDTTSTIMEKSKCNNYKCKNYYDIKEIIHLNGSKYVIVKKFKSINEHYSSPQIGAHILSYSKRIMNNVITLAEDLKIQIFYQDTDSIHIELDSLEQLKAEYKTKYKFEIDGEGLGQFNSDFTDDVLYSDCFIGLGKKSYCDRLVLKKGGYKYHIRMKGINKKAIMAVCKEKKCTPLQLYALLYNGFAIKFDLCCGGDHPRFKFDKALGVQYVYKFERTLQFL